MTYFDKFYELAVSDQAKEYRPFWTMVGKDEEELLKWCNTTLDALKTISRYRVYNMRRNLAAYRGIQFRSQSTKVNDLDRDHRDDVKKSKNPRIVMNHLLDMVEQHVSKTTKYRPAIASVPGSDDIVDSNVAKIADDLVENFWTKEGFDALMQKHTRIKRICGESYIFVLYDPDKGPYHPDWVAEVFEKNGIKKDPRKLTKGQINRELRKVKDWPKIELKDADGRPITDEKGELLEVDAPVRVGDIVYKLVMPWRVFLQRQDDESECEFLFYTELRHISDLKAQHPEKAHKLEDVKPAEEFDPSTLAMEKTQDMIEVIHFYHKTTRHLDRGRYIKFTRDTILSNSDNPYEGPFGRILPCDRLTDLNPPGTIDADALTTHGIPAQHLYNITVSMKARNRFIFAHPKWFVPQGAVKAESLGNTSSLVQYKGPTPPVLSQPGLEGTDSMQEWAKEDLQQIMGVFGVSRGAPPSGIKAGVALQFLDEQENERENLAISKHNASIRNIAKQTLSIMGLKYADDEGRLEDILGRTRAAEIQDFSFADLSSIDDVDLQTSSALPLQKSARIQTLMDLSERYPTEVDGRQVLEMIGLGQSDKYVSLSTVAVRAAENENEKLLRTGEMNEVEQWEDHIMHYYIHLTMANETSMKKYLTKELRDELTLHMQQHEMFMVEIMKKNPAYGQLIMQKFPNFPSFLIPEDATAALAAMPPQGAVVPMEGMQQMGQEQALPPGAGMEAPMEVMTPPGLPSNQVPGEAL